MAFWINNYGCQPYPRHGHLSVNQLKNQSYCQGLYPTFNPHKLIRYLSYICFLFQFGSVCKNEYLTVCPCTITCLFSNPRLNWNNYTISNMWRASSIIGITLFVGQPSQLFKRSFQLGSYFCSQMDCELQVGYKFFNNLLYTYSGQKCLPWVIFGWKPGCTVDIFTIQTVTNNEI